MIAGEEYELTASQLLIWLGMQRHPDAPIYNMVMTFRIASAVDTGHFGDAFNQIVAESDSLRSVFTNNVGRPTTTAHPVRGCIIFSAWRGWRCIQHRQRRWWRRWW